MAWQVRRGQLWEESVKRLPGKGFNRPGPVPRKRHCLLYEFRLWSQALYQLTLFLRGLVAEAGRGGRGA